MNFIQLALAGALPLLFIGTVLAFIRLVRGPSLPDRVVALDLVITSGVAIIAVYAIATGQSVYLDVAVVLALTSFLGTVAFAYYVERTA
jgi:multicomponent Na+:H+ antiporter subunit F